MLSNHEYFLSNSREECCNSFYEWNFYSCTGSTPTLTNGEYYPDWSGGSSTPTCLKDGNIPNYMLYNQRWYLSSSLRQCCERHFYYDINSCLGTSPDTSSVGTDKWYVDYAAETCVKDCEGVSPCGGLAESWDELFEDKKECCGKKLYWNSKCLTKSI